MEFYDKLDRFAMNKYVKERAEDFIKLFEKYKHSELGAVNAAKLEVNKWLRTIELDAHLFQGVPCEEDMLKLSAPALKQHHKDDACGTRTRLEHGGLCSFAELIQKQSYAFQ